MASHQLSDDDNDLLQGMGRYNANSDDDGVIRSDEAEEDNNGEDGGPDAKSRRIDPATSKKRIVRNPQPKLNAERIQGPKGVQTIEKYFEGFKFHGKGHEKSDLDRVMKRLEHWAHRLFPKYRFDDFLEKLEKLGTKKNVQVFLKRYRLDMELPTQDIADHDLNANTEEQPAPEEAPVDEFDKLIAEQIEKQKQSTNEQDSRIDSSSNPVNTDGNVLGSAQSSELSDEVKARIEFNRQRALELKRNRLKRLEEERKQKQLQESQVNHATPDSTKDISNKSTDDLSIVVDVQNKPQEEEDNNQTENKTTESNIQSQVNDTTPDSTKDTSNKSADDLSIVADVQNKSQEEEDNNQTENKTTESNIQSSKKNYTEDSDSDAIEDSEPIPTREEMLEEFDAAVKYLLQTKKKHPCT